MHNSLIALSISTATSFDHGPWINDSYPVSFTKISPKSLRPTYASSMGKHYQVQASQKICLVCPMGFQISDGGHGISVAAERLFMFLFHGAAVQQSRCMTVDDGPELEREKTEGK